MSGLMKSVKKVFRKVTKAVGKVAPVALAAAAIFFTAAGAMSPAGGMGGWAENVNSAIQKMAGTGILADTLAGAVTQAGYGAIIGGVGGAVMGKGAMKGAQYGSLAGAVTGGVTGYMTNPISGSASSPPPIGSASSGSPIATKSAIKPVGTLAKPAVAPVSWHNSRLAGGAAEGAFQGVGAFFGGGEEEAANIASLAKAEDRAAISANYTNLKGSGLLANYQVPKSGGLSPKERFGSGQTSFEWNGVRIAKV